MSTRRISDHSVHAVEIVTPFNEQLVHPGLHLTGWIATWANVLQTVPDTLAR